MPIYYQDSELNLYKQENNRVFKFKHLVGTDPEWAPIQNLPTTCTKFYSIHKTSFNEIDLLSYFTLKVIKDFTVVDKKSEIFNKIQTLFPDTSIHPEDVSVWLEANIKATSINIGKLEIKDLAGLVYL